MATAVILTKQKQRARKIQASDYPISKIVEGSRQVKINDIVPFRVRFTTITVPGYSPLNIPGIGIQVIGFSNYIL
jgi:hypothetical protein